MDVFFDETYHSYSLPGLHDTDDIFFMKWLKTNNIETVTYCRMQLSFDLPSTILKKEVIFLLENIGCVVTLFVRW